MFINKSKQAEIQTVVATTDGDYVGDVNSQLSGNRLYEIEMRREECKWRYTDRPYMRCEPRTSKIKGRSERFRLVYR